MKFFFLFFDFGEVIGFFCFRNKGKFSIYKRKSKKDD